MPDYNGGTASIRIKADGRGFQQEVEAIVKRARGDVNVKLDVDTRELERTRARLKAQGLDLNAEIDTARAAAELAAFRRREETRTIRQRVVLDRSNFDTAMARFRGDGLGLPGRGAIRIGVVVAAGEAIVQLAGLAAEAGQAYKALALLPAAGFAASAGLAGLAIGGQGVGDAFKAMKQESSASAGAVNNQAGAVRSARAAQRQLADAYRESSRNLRDLNNDYADSALNVEDAEVAVQEAADRMNEVMNDPTSSRTAKERADIDYRQSLARLRDAQNKNADLAQDTQRENAAGVQGSKEVVAALDAVASAKEALEQGGGGGGGIDKTAAALAKLSPSAREFVLTAQSLGPAWTQARKDIQEPLFSGMGPALKSLADAQLPTLKTGLANINREINTGLRSSMLLLTGPQMQKDFALSLSNTQGLFAGIGRSMAPLTQAATSLITVGSSFLPGLGDGIENASKKFDNFITNAARTGQLRDWMQQGVTASKQLGDGIGNVGSIIASVFRAAGAEGNQLEGFVNTTQRWADQLKSVSGQDTMMRFFSDARQDLAAWKPLLEALPGLIGSVLDGVHLWSSILLPFLKAGADLLRDHEGVVKLAVAAYLGFKTIGPILGTVGPAIAGLTTQVAASTAAASGGLGKLKAGAGALAGMFNPYIVGAVAAGGVALGFASSLNEASDIQRRYVQRTQEVKVANERMVEALRTSGGATNEDVLSQQDQRVQQFRKQLGETASEAPSLWDKVVGNATAAFQVFSGEGAKGMDRLNQLADRGNMAGIAQRLQDAMAGSGLTDRQLSEAIAGTQEQFAKIFDSMNDGSGDATQLQRNLVELRQEFQNNQQTAQQKTSEAFKSLGKDAGSAADDVDRLTQAIANKNRQDDAFNNSRLKAAQAQTGLTEGIKSDTGALPTIAQDGLINLDDTQGQRLQQNVFALKDGYTQAIAAAKLYAEQNKYSEEQTQTYVRQTADAYIQKGKDQLVAAGIPLPAVNALFDKEQLTAGTFTSQFVAKTEDANSRIDVLIDKIRRAREATTLPILLKTLITTGTSPTTDLGSGTQTGALSQLGLLSGPKASGGFLPTTGPGTDREDGILAATPQGIPVAMVNGGEHITNTPMSQKYARELSMINAGTFPKYAAGGVLPGGVTAEEQSTLGGGTINTSIWQAVKAQFPNAVLSSGYRAGDPGYHGIKQAVDIGGPAMQQIADWLYGMKSQLAQIIWNPGPAWYNVKKNQVGTGVATADGAAARAVYGEATMAQHGDHVHVAAEDPIQATTGQVGTGTAASGAAPNAATTTTSQVTYAQQGLPANMSERDLSILQGKASVDQANSERNKVYADPASTAADKQAADIKYLQAQNSLQSTQDGDTERFTIKGAATKGVGILVDGLLGGLGLENSIFAGSNPYNQAFTKAADFYGFMKGDAYNYTPQNLPSTVTTTTMTPSVATGTPTPQAPAPSAAPTQVAYNPAGGVEQWRATFASVLNTLGAPSDLLEPGLKQMQTESGGNPKAINLTDSNAAKGTPSKGLMQVIDPTFAAFKSDKYPNDIWDPQANIAAAVSYGAKTYPDLITRWGSGVGYDQGGVASGIGAMLKQTIRPERVLSPRQTQAFESMLPLMESINASAPTAAVGAGSVPAMTPAATTGGPAVDRSVHVHVGGHIVGLDDVVQAVDRAQSMATMGTV